jgi:hypothetical protein
MKVASVIKCLLLAIIMLILRLLFKNSDKDIKDDNVSDFVQDENKNDLLSEGIQKDFNELNDNVTEPARTENESLSEKNFHELDDFSESQFTDKSLNECFNENLNENFYEKFDGNLNLSSDDLSSDVFNSQNFEREKIRKIAKASYEKFIRSDKNDSYFGCNEYDSSGSDKYGTRPRLQKKRKHCIKFKSRTKNLKIKSRKSNLVKNGKLLMISPTDLEKMNFIVSPHEDRHTQRDNRLIEC